MITVGATVPNYLVVNPDGTIGANFTGHVHAQGLDLDAGTSSTPPDTDRVRWVRTSDGAAVAYLAGYSTAGQEVVGVGARAAVQADLSRVSLHAEDDTGAFQALLQLT